MNLALEKELNKDYIEAVKLYESKLEDCSCVPEEDYINLAFLYWQFAADYGFSSYYNIPKELRNKGGEKYLEILNSALTKYPNSLELKFWEKYFPHRHYYDEFPQKDCEQMIAENKGDESLVPYFYLYLFDEVKYKSERDKLLELCNATPTAKFNYIKSIIE